jgi:hypothetical protein
MHWQTLLEVDGEQKCGYAKAQQDATVRIYVLTCKIQSFIFVPVHLEEQLVFSVAEWLYNFEISFY